MPKIINIKNISSITAVKSEIKTYILSILLILFTTLALSTPFLKQGLYIMHDDQHIARLFLFDKSLKGGQFPVRWVDGLGFGFGYPLFVFYPPFVYMLGELIHIIGFDFINSIKIVFFLSLLLSGFSMFIFAKELWGKAAALVSSIFYICAPYRALDVYARGALAESFSFVWLPLILWSFYKTAKKQTANYIYLSGAFLALLMITHNLIFLPFGIILTVYLLSLLFLAKNKKLFVKHILYAGILGAGLAAFFWIPSLLEKKYTIVDQILLTNLADYKIHFVYPQQLWNWQWGFGGSAKGLMDGISFKIGKIHIIISLFSLLFMIISYKHENITKSRFTLPATFLILFIFSAFMTTMYSQAIWDMIIPLAYLQFPWRFLTFIVLFSSLLVGYFIYQLRLSFIKLTFSGIILIALMVPNYKLFKPQLYRENLTDTEATSTEKINWDVSKSSFEYMKTGVGITTLDDGSKMLNIEKADLTNEKLLILDGNVNLEITGDQPHKLHFKTTSEQNSYIRANIINFPGWELKIDNIAKIIDEDNKFKLISFPLPPGKHTVLIEFKNTPIIMIANIISVLSIASLFIVLIYKQTLKERSRQ